MPMWPLVCDYNQPSILIRRITGDNILNKTYDDTSYGWLFQPPVCPVSCDGSVPGIPKAWWQLAKLREPKFMTDFWSGTETATSLVGASATLQFTGTDVWYFGTRSPLAGTMDISLDGKVTNVSSISPRGSPVLRQQLLWSAHGLDDSVQHRLVVTMTGGNIIDVDRVEVTLPERPPTTNNPNPDPSTLPNESSGGPSHGLKLAAIISGVVCGVLLIVVAALATWYFYLRRHRKPAYGKIRAFDDGAYMKPLPAVPAFNRSQSSVVVVEAGSGGNTSIEAVRAINSPGGESIGETVAQTPFSPAGVVTGNVTIRDGPSRQDGALLRYALVRTASMRPSMILVDGYEYEQRHERDPLSATTGPSRTARRTMPVAIPALPPPPPSDSQSPTILSSDVQFTPHRGSMQTCSEETDLLALAIQEDEWPQPPTHIPSPSPISPEGTVTAGMVYSPSHMRRLYAAAYPSPSVSSDRTVRLPLPPAPEHPPPAPPSSSTSASVYTFTTTATAHHPPR
ncbi:hypothetical protein BKA62DRAFT_753052 [Auriculariales sp. MPI-PUGE-AT-0066]|nr:hypothetical protein BKA62DRAFT_753052 [Auriculariales sp. MPI-PUGE-AT-0066]